MIGFGLDSELDQHLAALTARRVPELTPHDYIKAMRLLLTERTQQVPGRRHVNPIDFDDQRVDALFDLLADVTTCRLKGRNGQLPALYERITDVLLAVMESRLADKLVNVRQDEIAHRARAAFSDVEDLDLSGHAEEYRAEARMERLADLERARDFMEEVGMRS